MIINDVHRGIVKRKNRKRVGRGLGSGHGKTAADAGAVPAQPPRCRRSPCSNYYARADGVVQGGEVQPQAEVPHEAGLVAGADQIL